MFVANEDQRVPPPLSSVGAACQSKRAWNMSAPTGFTKRAVVHLILQTCHSYGVTFHCTDRKIAKTEKIDKAIAGKEYPGLRRIFGHLRGAEMGA